MSYQKEAIRDPAAYRAAIFDEFRSDYKFLLDDLNTKLQDTRFAFQSVHDMYEAQLNDELIFRHALPFFITQETFFRNTNKEALEYLYCMMLFHTLPLTQLDSHYDGVRSMNNNSQPHDMPILGASTFALSATYEAARHAAGLEHGKTLLLDALPVTSFVKQRMYQDTVERFDILPLHQPHAAHQQYVTSSQSRLYGSGYWEVMAIGAFSSRGKPFPTRLHHIDIRLRKLRQLVDELADIEEDIRAGHVTLPLIIAAERHPHRQQLIDHVSELWKTDSDSTWQQICKIIYASRAPQIISTYAKGLWTEATEELDTYLGSKAAGYQLLFDLKRAKLDLLEDAHGL